MLDQARIQSLLRYALLAAAQNEDWSKKQLGPIHLIKYLYLADLEYAKHNQGQTYTGIEWTFHHFGPWSAAVHNILTATLLAIGAKLSVFPSQFSDADVERWALPHDEEAYIRMREALPIEVKGIIDAALQKHGTHTGSLLKDVYATAPMIHAAPEERLDFQHAVKPASAPEPAEPFVPLLERLTKKQMRQLKEQGEALRARFAARAAGRPVVQPAPMATAPDECFEKGAAWLDSLAGEPFPEQAELHFDESVWKSAARRGESYA